MLAVAALAALGVAPVQRPTRRVKEAGQGRRVKEVGRGRWVKAAEREAAVLVAAAQVPAAQEAAAQEAAREVVAREVAALDQEAAVQQAHPTMQAQAAAQEAATAGRQASRVLPLTVTSCWLRCADSCTRRAAYRIRLAWPPAAHAVRTRLPQLAILTVPHC